jgi:modulator of FtsH protease HflK
VRIKQEAEAYRAEIIARSTGDADRFTAVYRAYKVAQDVTIQRLYLETMEEILKNSNKIIIDKAAQGQTGVLPYLPLPNLLNSAPPTAAPPAGTATGATPVVPPAAAAGAQPSTGRR